MMDIENKIDELQELVSLNIVLKVLQILSTKENYFL